MKAQVLYKGGEPFRLEEVPDPKPGPGEAVARVLACGSGLTIHHTRAGRTTANFPIIIGHEITGRSEEQKSELQSLMRISYAVLCLIKKIQTKLTIHTSD